MKKFYIGELLFHVKTSRYCVVISHASARDVFVNFGKCTTEKIIDYTYKRTEKKVYRDGREDVHTYETPVYLEQIKFNGNKYTFFSLDFIDSRELIKPFCVGSIQGKRSANPKTLRLRLRCFNKNEISSAKVLQKI